MRYSELKYRNKLLSKEADQKAEILALMYADFEYINRNQTHLRGGPYMLDRLAANLRWDA